MKLLVKIANRNYQVDTENPLSIAISLQFNGAQPNAYGVEKARASACEADALIGDTRRGGSCNFEQIKFIPHCNGTHTECVGHITHERISVHDCLQDAFISAALISVEPENANQTNETYSVEINENDKLITRKSLERAEARASARAHLVLLETPLLTRGLLPENSALIIRTIPNDKSKLTKTYLDEIPPFFSTEAMEFIREIGIKHLLVDLPSIDRIFDEGKLSNHRIFWNVEQESFEVSKESLIHNTITELIYVPKEIQDGEYLLNLQIAPFASDASPSRPLLFKIYE